MLWAGRWYCRYAVSYRDLEAMITERGVAVDHSTIYRWALRKGQARAFSVQGGTIGEARIVERAFGVAPCALRTVI